jgi:argininosuccinate lyase
MAKLWDKGCELDSLVEEFTVGNDYILDMELVPADCAGSIAHARMLESIGLLTREECAAAEEGLRRVLREYDGGEFVVRREDEDCHTAIEGRLTAIAGDVGKKIHTGRSRNDQVLCALRLYGREGLLDLTGSLLDCAAAFTSFASSHRLIPMPGRTHLQPAMPSSIELWAGSFAEDLLDCLVLMEAAFRLNNRCPLGSAASYGVPLPLNREQVSALLGFDEPHHNLLSANNSRGRIELIILECVEQILVVLSKAATDLILFSMPEFGYFSLPEKLCSGSSIMPQKKNPDALELLRAKAATVSSYADRLRAVIRSLPSGYNRDFQETKEPFMMGLSLGISCLRIAMQAMTSLSVDTGRLLSGFTSGIFATDAALDAVRKGASFREAYRSVGTNLSAVEMRDPVGALVQRDYTGAPGRLELEKTDARIEGWRNWEAVRRSASRNAIEALFGRPVPLFNARGSIRNSPQP